MTGLIFMILAIGSNKCVNIDWYYRAVTACSLSMDDFM